MVTSRAQGRGPRRQLCPAVAVWPGLSASETGPGGAGAGSAEWCAARPSSGSPGSVHSPAAVAWFSADGGQHSPPTGVPLRPSRMKRLARAHPRPVTAARGRPSAPLHALSSRTSLCPRCCLSSCRGWRGCSLVTGPGPWCAVAQHREGRPRSRPPSPPPRRPCPPRFARRGNRVWLHSCLPGSRASS